MKRIKSNSKTILANDPSYTAWGYVVLNCEGKVIEAGCIKTEPSSKKLRIRAGDDFARRCNTLSYKLKSIIEMYNIDYIVSELPHGSQNARAAKMVGGVPAILEAISIFTGIGLEWFSEGDVKKYLFGRQSVAKNEMIQKMKYIYGTHNTFWKGVKYMDEAIADALGVFQTAINQSSVLKFLRNNA